MTNKNIRISKTESKPKIMPCNLILLAITFAATHNTAANKSGIAKHLFNADFLGLTAIPFPSNCGKSHRVNPLASDGLTQGISKPISPFNLPKPHELNLTTHLSAKIISGALTVFTALTEALSKIIVLWQISPESSIILFFERTDENLEFLTSKTANDIA